MTTIPGTRDPCIPADTSCCDEWESFEDIEGVQQRALAYASATFRSLTGFRVGNCPVTVRPCRAHCLGPPTWMTFPVFVGGWAATMPPAAFTPVNTGGVWTNVSCGCGRGDLCSCATVCEIILPGEAASVQQVTLDVATLDASAYRLDPPNRLVRTDGDCWPVCQDMNAAVGQTGSFSVSYIPGAAGDALDAYAVGVLACEYAKACTGETCRLPANVASVARQGVILTMGQKPGAKAEFPNGLTGIREVDDRVIYWNPHGLSQPSVVWSPDTPKHRYGPALVMLP